jgi:pimeloyl-ACP methyl ester carboxylesterase
VDEMDVAGVSLDVRRSGGGRPLLFLHGEDGLQWSGPVVEELAETFEVTAPLHPGWGTPARPSHVKDIDDLAYLYRELLEEWSEPVVLVGCSFGAWLAAEIAVQRPANLAALVLVAPTGVKLGARDQRDFADIWAADFSALPEILYGDPAGAPALGDLSDQEYLALAKAQEATARYCWKPYMHDPKLLHRLRRVQVPTLVVSGDADRFSLIPGYYERYAALIGDEGARTEVLPGVGHRVEEESPAAVAAAVAAFAGATGSDLSQPGPFVSTGVS